MNKLAFFLGLFLGLAFFAYPQTTDEWIRQKKTQRKYLVQQLEALHVYLGYLKKGYGIAQKGLTTIENIKAGNVNLHRDFFGSLKKINPAVANSVKVMDIAAFQVYMVREMKRVYRFCNGNENFSPEEVRYVAEVHTNMLLLADASISELRIILDPDKAEMTDRERMLRIGSVHQDISDQLEFVHVWGEQVRRLSAARGQERHQVTPTMESLGNH